LSHIPGRLARPVLRGAAKLVNTRFLVAEYVHRFGGRQHHQLKSRDRLDFDQKRLFHQPIHHQ
jgi:hypothetical protein